MYTRFADSNSRQGIEKERNGGWVDPRKHVLSASVGRYVNYEYRRKANTSRRNGNQLGVPSYDWDLSYWQATLANLHWDLAGLSRRPTAFWFPPGPNPWDSILLPTMRPYLHVTSFPLRLLALTISNNVSYTCGSTRLPLTNRKVNFQLEMASNCSRNLLKIF